MSWGVVVLVAVLAASTTARVTVWGGGERAVWAEAVQQSPQKPRVWVQWGAVLVRDGDRAGAARAFRRAIDLGRDPTRRLLDAPMRVTDVARLNLAMLRAEAGDYAAALQWMAQIQPRRAIGIVPVLERQWRDEQATGGASEDY